MLVLREQDILEYEKRTTGEPSPHCVFGTGKTLQYYTIIPDKSYLGLVYMKVMSVSDGFRDMPSGEDPDWVLGTIYRLEDRVINRGITYDYIYNSAMTSAQANSTKNEPGVGETAGTFWDEYSGGTLIPLVDAEYDALHPDYTVAIVYAGRISASPGDMASIQMISDPRLSEILEIVVVEDSGDGKTRLELGRKKVVAKTIMDAIQGVSNVFDQGYTWCISEGAAVSTTTNFTLRDVDAYTAKSGALVIWGVPSTGWAIWPKYNGRILIDISLTPDYDLGWDWGRWGILIFIGTSTDLAYTIDNIVANGWNISDLDISEHVPPGSPVNVYLAAMFYGTVEGSHPTFSATITPKVIGRRDNEDVLKQEV